MKAKCEERCLGWSADASGVYRFSYSRDGHHFLWRFRAEARAAALSTISRDASNPELVLDYVDAAILTGKVREVVPVVDSCLLAAVEPMPGPCNVAAAEVASVDLKAAEFDDLFSDHDGLGSSLMFGAMLLVSSAFWAAFIWLALGAMQ